MAGISKTFWRSLSPSAAQAPHGRCSQAWRRIFVVLKKPIYSVFSDKK
jgi:hypothetical protein